MKLYTFDTEVFVQDWLLVAKERETGEYTIIANDNQEAAQFFDDNADALFFGFNSKNYDQYIVKGIYAGLAPEEIKEINDWIISGGQGWQHPLLAQNGFRFNNIDIMDDMQKGLSLKAIEGHLGMSIEESSVDFNISRALTDREMEETIHYCKHDVDATEKLVELRKDYLNSKIAVGKMAGIPPERALAMTNAKLTAAFLRAKRPAQSWTDERQYVYPANLKREYIPQEVFDFFDRMYDPTVSDEELFSSKLEISVGGTPGVVGFGGIHAAIPNYMWKGSRS